MNQEDGAEPDTSDTMSARPILLKVDVSENATSVIAETHLQVAGALYHGVAARSEGQIERAAAAATLRAVEQAKPVAMTVAETMYANAGAAQVAVVVVEMTGMRRPLTGSALVDAAPEDAFARAALDAINRIITDPRLIADAARNARLGAM